MWCTCSYYLNLLTVEPLEECELPCMDGVFALDVSNSIGGQNFSLVKDFLENILEVVNISPECSHAALILFKADVRIRFDLNRHTDKDELIEAVRDITYKSVSGRGTNTPEALDVMRIAAQNGSLGLRDGFVHLGVVITDGNPRLSFQGVSVAEMERRTRVASRALHGSNIYNEIYAIGIGNIDDEVLANISSSTDNILQVAMFNESLLDVLRRRLVTQICRRE